MDSASTTNLGKLSDEEMRAYALQGIRADVDRRAAEVRQGMSRLKEALDTAVKGTYPRTRYAAAIDGLMASLVAFDQAMARADAMSAESYKEQSDDA